MLAYNLMMLAIVAVCLAAIHLALDGRQRRLVRRCFVSLIASIKKEWGVRRGFRVLTVLPAPDSLRSRRCGPWANCSPDGRFTAVMRTFGIAANSKGALL